MGNVIIEPQSFTAQLEEDQLELVQLRILLKQTEFEGLFDQVEVWRSSSTFAGPYEELTAAFPKTARLPRSAKDAPSPAIAGANVNVDGLTLLLRIDEKDDYVVSFSTPATLADAAAELTSQGQNRFRAYVDPDGKFVVETTMVGTGATIRVTGGDAVPLLGLTTVPPDDFNFGRDGRINLCLGVEEYVFTDLKGSKKFYYRTRYRNRNTQATSEFSQAFSVGAILGISPPNVICGYLDLVTGAGAPLSGQQVKVFNPLKGELIEGKLVTGREQVRLTDKNGHVSFNLVRGAKYTVAITGTSIVRDIIAPTDPAVKIFPLLGEDVGTQDDVFKVQVPDIIFAERRTL